MMRTIWTLSAGLLVVYDDEHYYKEVIDWAQKVNANKTFLSHMTAHID